MQTKLSDGSVMISGFLGKDAEYKQVGEKNSSLTRFSVKVGERNNEAIWVNCQCWHSTARACMGLKKLDTVLCVGRIKTYSKNDGTQGVNLECEAVFVQPIAQQVAVPQATNNTLQGVDGVEDFLSDDGCPF